MKKQEIINELREISSELKKSPRRRDIPSRLNRECIKQFGSFNEAKKKGGLTLTHIRNKPLLESSKKLDKDLVRIVAYITFDGHLRKDLRAFHLSSNNEKELKSLRKIIHKKFRLDISKIEPGNGYGKGVLKYWYFNANLCKFLNSMGAPKGDKVTKRFDIPNWIKNNKKFAREYLKTAYLCEGSKNKKSKIREEIQINLSKCEEILQDGLHFMESLKILLKKFNINSTRTWSYGGNKRKRDGKITKEMRFKIKADSFNTFINEIGWYK